MVPGWLAPLTVTGVPVGSEPEVQPLVAVLPPVPEQCAAWPMYVFVPSLNTKFAVHWAPLVNVWTPGWIVALPAGAQARAPGAVTSSATSDAAVSAASLRAFKMSASRSYEIPLRVGPLRALPYRVLPGGVPD